MRSAVLAYGALGLPLAFAALPLYVHVPRLYAGEAGLSLASVGAVLLAARIVDAVTDPLIGWARDHVPRPRAQLLAGVLLLGASLPLLLSPPAGTGASGLFVLLVLVSLGYSAASIGHAAWGAELTGTPTLRTRLVASREGFALLGVLLAAALPGLLAGADGEAAGVGRLVWVFLPLLGGCAAWTLLLAPPAPARPSPPGDGWRGMGTVLGDRGFARLLLVLALNGIAAAVPSTTVLFFVTDVLQAGDRPGLFLVLYFLAAASSLPAWVALAARIGRLRAWLAGMLLAVVVFAWAGLLTAGDSGPYALICVLSGFALGADLALPPALLAELIARSGSAPRLAAGACFGWWNFVVKANLALAAGLALPLLALLGYAPGSREPDALAALSAVYAFLPLVLKLGAIALLWQGRGRLEPAAAPVATAHFPSQEPSR